METTKFTKEQAKASDAKLSELHELLYRARRGVENQRERLHYAAGDRKQGYGSRAYWRMTLEEVLLKVEGQTGMGHHGIQVAEALQEYREGVAQVQGLEERVEVQNREWYEHGQWSRFIVVGGGHIHNSLGCFTLRWDTRTYWLPELSGETEAEAVEQYGEALCSHCFPSAPTSWKQRETVPLGEDGKPLTRRQQQELREIRQAEKQAKEAEKQAAGVFDPDTGELLSKTERGWTNAIASTLGDIRWYEFDHPSMPKWERWVEYAIRVLAVKRGVDAGELRKELEAKADKSHAAKIRKAWRELKADCASGRWTRSMIKMDSGTVRYGQSIGEELVFGRED